MKKIVLTLIGLAAFAAALSADDKPINFDKLPSAAKAYIQTNFPGEKTSFVVKDDDLIRPDYTVVLMNGIKLEFDHSGALTQISSPEGIPAEIADVVIRIMDMCDHYGIDLAAAIEEKHEFNKTRPYLHGKKF